MKELIRLAVIATLRTSLNYFLEKDLEHAVEHAGREEPRGRRTRAQR
jgi:uncharacterized membrane protein